MVTYLDVLVSDGKTLEHENRTNGSRVPASGHLYDGQKPIHQLKRLQSYGLPFAEAKNIDRQRKMSRWEKGRSW